MTDIDVNIYNVEEKQILDKVTNNKNSLNEPYLNENSLLLYLAKNKQLFKLFHKFIDSYHNLFNFNITD